MSQHHPSKRLAYLVAEFPSPTEQFIANEVAEMQRVGFLVTVLSLSNTHGEALPSVTYCRKVSSLGLWLGFLNQLLREPTQLIQSLRVVQGGNRNARFADKLRGLRSWIRAVDLMDQRSDFDHVHAHFMNTPTVVGIAFANMLSLPFSFTAHAHDLYVDGSNLAWKVEQSQFAVTCTQYNQRFMQQQLPPNQRGKVSAIYHGLNPDLWPFREPTPILESYQILTVARLVEKKGIHIVLDALERLDAHAGKVKYSIVGDGPDRMKLEQKSAGLQGPEVAFLGMLSHNRISEMYAQADVLVHAAIIATDGDRDGIPNVLVEAMACGVPVVAAAVSAIPELVIHGETGLLVPANDPTALAEALQMLRADVNLRQRLAIKARKHVEQHFHIRSASQQLLSLFAPSDQ